MKVKIVITCFNLKMSTNILKYRVCNFNDSVKKCVVECEEFDYHEIFFFKELTTSSIESFIEILKQNLEFTKNVKFTIKKQTLHEVEIVKVCGSFVYKIVSNQKYADIYVKRAESSYEDMIDYFKDNELFNDVSFPQQEYFEKMKQKTHKISVMRTSGIKYQPNDQFSSKLQTWTFYNEELFLFFEKQYVQQIPSYIRNPKDDVSELMTKRGYQIEFECLVNLD